MMSAIGEVAESAMSENKNAVLCYMPSNLCGFHLASWREQEAPDNPPMNLAAVRELVETAERGKFHSFFLADGLALRPLPPGAMSRTPLGSRFEPMTLLSALAPFSKRIGLVCTVSSSYSEPYNVARMFASLDHLSGGRAGWNVVTTSTIGAAANFGFDSVPDHAERYARCQEYLEVVTGLWDSWEDDAFICDRESGIYFDPDRLHQLNYHGEHLSAAGPLNIARPIQGHPVIAQAGSSPAGRAFAARNADIMITLQSDLEKSKSFYAEVKEQVAEYGRDPEHVKVLPTLMFSMGRSQAEADERLAQLDALVDPELGMAQLSEFIEADLSSVPLDGPLPDIPETRSGSKTRQRYFLDMAKRENLTVRELMKVAARVGIQAATPLAAVDTMQEWLDGDAADGFVIMFADANHSLRLFVDEVVPELQRRQLYHTDYRGSTFRENLGIPRPANRYVAAHR